MTDSPEAGSQRRLNGDVEERIRHAFSNGAVLGPVAVAHPLQPGLGVDASAGDVRPGRSLYADTGCRGVPCADSDFAAPQLSPAEVARRRGSSGLGDAMLDLAAAPLPIATMDASSFLATPTLAIVSLGQ